MLLSLRKKAQKSRLPFFSKFCKQLFKMSAQRGDSIPSSKLSVLSLLSDVIKLLSLAFFVSSSSFDLSLKSRYCLSKKLLIVLLILKISLKCKNKATLFHYFYFINFLSNTLKYIFLSLATHVVAYSAIYGNLIYRTDLVKKGLNIF